MLESITTESDETPANAAEAVKSAISKLVPVKTMLVSVFVVDVTAGKLEVESCSYWHKDVSVLTQA